jgi:hypothetical protein
MVRLLGEPAHQAAWRKGADGEGKAAVRLAKLLDGRGVTLLHDRRGPGRRTNIDHIAIGPGGVTVIDAKNVKGAVRVERRGGLLSKRTEVLRIGGRDRTGLVDKLERQIAFVQQQLAAVGLDPIPVDGALCLAAVDGLPLLRKLTVRGFLVDGPKGVAKRAGREGELTDGQVQAIAGELAARLRPNRPCVWRARQSGNRERWPLWIVFDSGAAS